MFRKKLRVVIFICVLLLTCLTNAFAAFAEEGAGSQSSSPGTPGQKPLGYLGTVLVNGGKVDNATDIPVSPKLRVEFDKNVVNSLIWTNNSQCFSMKSSNNETIPVNVTKVDDTVDFAQRQYIFVQPVSSLKTGTSYSLIISPNLQAKNGVSTLSGTTNGQGVTVAFKTQGAPPTTTTPAPKPAANVVTPTPTPNTASSSNAKTTSPNTVNPSSAAAPTTPSVSSDSKESATTTPDSSANQQLNQTTPSSAAQSANAAKKSTGIPAATWIAIIGAVLVAAWITVEIIARKKRNK